MLYGIDVSNYQSDQPSLSGKAFIVVKSTEGHTLVNTRRKAQAAWGRRHGCAVGWYHFLWPGSVAAQVDFFVHGNPAKSYDPTPVKSGDFIAVDFERTSAGSMASTADKNAMIRGLQAAYPHHRVGLYCNTTDWHNTDDFCGDFLWIADPSAPDGRPRIQHPWTFQQTAISGGIDVDAAHFDTLAQLQEWAHAKETDVALTDSDINKIIDGVTAKVLAGVGKAVLLQDGIIPVPGAPADNPTWTPKFVLAEILSRIDKVTAEVEALKASLGGLDPAAVEQAVVDKVKALKPGVTDGA